METDAPRIEHLLRALLEQAHDHALILYGTDERIAWVNAAAETMLGAKAADLVGRHTSEIFVPEDVAAGLPGHEFEVARRQGSAEDDRWTLRGDGSRFWASGLAYALRADDGTLLGYGKVIQNRTDWRLREETLRNQAAALAALDERKNLMISTLAHELRNPLAPLANAAELLRRGAPMEYPIKLIERQVDFIRRLVDDLIDATRVNAGKVSLRREPLVLQDVLLAAAETVRPRIDERRQQLALVLAPGPIRVDGDRDRLQQVFVNLMANAIRYTSACGHIWVKATIEGREAVVRVEDDGQGIAPEMLAHIFDLFAQAQPSSEGLGLGLALVKDLVTLHGGTVQANSDGLGKGSEFTVRLPLHGMGRASSHGA